jgi:hypothetical protein
MRLNFSFDMDNEMARFISVLFLDELLGNMDEDDLKAIDAINRLISGAPTQWPRPEPTEEEKAERAREKEIEEKFISLGLRLGEAFLKKLERENASAGDWLTEEPEGGVPFMTGPALVETERYYPPAHLDPEAKGISHTEMALFARSYMDEHGVEPSIEEIASALLGSEEE